MLLPTNLSMKLVNIHYKSAVYCRLVAIMLLGMFSHPLVMGQSLTLSQCLDSALARNRSIRLSELDNRLAAEKHQEAIGNLLPKLSAGGEYRHYTDLPYQLMPASVLGGPPDTYKEMQFGVPENLNANLQLNVPVINPAALGTLSVTKNARELALLQTTLSLEQIVTEVSLAYYNAQILISQIAFIDSGLIDSRKLVTITSALHVHDLARGTDVDRTRLLYEQLLAKRETVHAQYRQVTAYLGLIAGLTPDRQLEVEMPVMPTTGFTSDNQVITEQRILDQRLKMTRAELHAVNLSRLPVLSLNALYGTNGMGTTKGNSFFDFYPVGFAGIQLSVPLFTGGIVRHKAISKKIEMDKLSIQQETLADRNRIESENADRQYRALMSNLTAQQRQLSLAGRIYSGTALQHEQGLVGLTDVLAADASRREIQQNYINTLIGLYKAELEMKRTNGNLINVQ